MLMPATMTVVYRKATIEGGKDDLRPQAMSLLGKNALFIYPKILPRQRITRKQRQAQASSGHAKTSLLPTRNLLCNYTTFVDAAQTATYTREITVPKNGKATFVSVMLPFTLSINNDGVHTNEDGSCKFRLSKMNENSCITPQPERSIKTKQL